jgi:uncharacterized peroxidase-related enzyme
MRVDRTFAFETGNPARSPKKERSMSRIHTPATIDASPAAARPLLEAVKKMLGVAPNLFRVVANTPAGLEGYLGLNMALAKGSIDGPTRERLAMAVAEANACDYCLSAHTYLGKNVAKLDDAELTRNRDGASSDPKAAAALRFATQVVRERGHVNDADLKAVKAAGYSDGEVIEIVLHVALNTLTNYVNSVAQTEIDFPVVSARKGA